jgi:hypothetical protein
MRGPCRAPASFPYETWVESCPRGRSLAQKFLTQGIRSLYLSLWDDRWSLYG